jgi:hypothetical protein
MPMMLTAGMKNVLLMIDPQRLYADRINLYRVAHLDQDQCRLVIKSPPSRFRVDPPQ